MKRSIVQLYLPESTRVGEVQKVEVSVFNHFTEPNDDPFLYAYVTLFGEANMMNQNETESEDGNQLNQIEFLNASKLKKTCSFQNLEEETSNQQKTKKIKIIKNSEASVDFFIRFKNSGNYQVKVQVEIIKKRKNLITDEVEKNIKVEHEGITIYSHKTCLIDLRLQERIFNVLIVTELKDSVRNEISVIAFTKLLSHTKKLM